MTEILDSGTMPTYLTEAEIASLLTVEDALVAVEECVHRLARGVIDNRPRARLLDRADVVRALGEQDVDAAREALGVRR